MSFPTTGLVAGTTTHTVGDVTYIFNGIGWDIQAVLPTASSNTTEFTAIVAQTEFIVNYTVGNVEVYRNGSLLQTTDYVAGNGTSVVIASAVENDEITVVAFDAFEVANTYTKVESDANYEPKDATILKDGDIGVTVLAPDGDGSQLTNLPTGGMNYSDIGDNYVVSGCTWATSADLTSNFTGGVVNINGNDVVVESTTRNFTASKDTYVDVNDTGTLVYTELADTDNGLNPPSLAVNSVRLAIVETDVDNVIDTDDYKYKKIGMVTSTDSGNNTANGPYALYSNTTGTNNIANGYYALYNNTIGANNTANGYQALHNNTTGANNTGIGYQTGYNLTTGQYNVLNGYQAGYSLTNGSDNVCIGRNTLKNVTGGSKNVVLGLDAGIYAPGTSNIIIGEDAGYNIGTSSNSIFLGKNSVGASGLTNQIAIGFGATTSVSNEITLGNSSITRFRVPGLGIDWTEAPGGATNINELTDGYNVSGSIGLGTDALQNDDGSSNYQVAVGFRALRNATNASQNVAIGNEALIGITTGTLNTAIGSLSGTYITTGTSNCAFGSNALQGDATSKLTGSYNTGIGYQTGYSLTTGQYNVLMGYKAGYSLTSGLQNVIIGRFAGLELQEKDENVMIGYGAGRESQQKSSVSIGTSAGHSNDGISCVFIGSSAGSAAIARGGNACTIVGGNAAADAYFSGEYNTVLGSSAAGQLESGQSNTVIGAYAAYALKLGSNNIVIGKSAAPSGDVSNEITLGDSAITSLRCQVTTITSLSDERDKDNIQDLDTGLDFINSLRPVRFDWNMRDGGKVGENDIGFIAQELQQAQVDNDTNINHLVMDNNPDKLEAGYGMLIAPMVQAIKELKAELDTVKAEINTLKGN